MGAGPEILVTQGDAEASAAVDMQTPDATIQTDHDIDQQVSVESRLSDTAAAEEGYTYTTAEGNTYHADSREKAIGACSVLAGMDAATRNALFNAIDRGKAEMTKAEQQSKDQSATHETEEPKPATHHPTTKREPTISKGYGAEDTMIVLQQEALQASARPLQDTKVADLSKRQEEATTSSELKEPVDHIRPEPDNKTTVEDIDMTQIEIMKQDTKQAAHLDMLTIYHVAEQANNETSQLFIEHNEVNRAVQADTAGDETADINSRLLFGHVEERPASPGSIEPNDLSLEVEREVSVGTIPYDEGQLLPPEVQTTKFDVADSEVLLPTVALSPPEQTEALIRGVETVTWKEVLEKEPEEVYDDFINALRSIIDLQTKQLSPDIDNGNVNDIESVPAIALTVVKRLSELATKEKEAALLVVRNIVEVIQNMNPLTANTDDPEIIAATQAELKELVITLFEQLRIEYEPEDIELFIAVLLQPAFQPFQPLQPERIVEIVDLEHDGTHEAKVHWAQTATGLLLGVERDVKRLLGMLALFKYHTQQQTYTAIA